MEVFFFRHLRGLQENSSSIKNIFNILVSVCLFSVCINDIPNRIDSDSSQLRKGTLEYWTSCARSEFLDLFTSRDVPTLFSFPSNLPLRLSNSENPPEPSSSLFHQARLLAECSDQLRFVSNLLYVAWALRSFIETGDQFLVSMLLGCSTVLTHILGNANSFI